MKKIFLTLILIICSIGLFGQSQLRTGITVGNTADTVKIDKIETGTGNKTIKFYRGSSLLTPVEQGVYNILDYGAIPDDGVDDHAAIQAAINAAHTYIGTESLQGATVFIPGGEWNISVADTLKSYIHIECDKNAYFEFPVSYAGNMWVNPISELLKNAWVTGGSYYSASKDWNCINLISSDETVVMCHFKDMYIHKAEIAINLAVTGSHYCNGNIFEDLIFWNCVEGIKTREGGSSLGIDGNTFMNIQFQADATGSNFAIDSLSGSYNQFINYFLWDVGAGSPCKTVLTATTAYNQINGTNIDNYGYSDLGTNNRVFSTDSWLKLDADSYTGDKAVISGSNTDYTGYFYNNNATAEAAALYAYSNPAPSAGWNYGVYSKATGSTGGSATNVGVYGAAVNGTTNYGVYSAGNMKTTGDLFISKSGGKIDLYNSDITLTQATNALVIAGGAMVYTPISTSTVTDSLTATQIISRVIVYNESAATDLTGTVNQHQIVAGTNGQIITIVGVSDTNTLKFDDGFGIQLAGGASCTLGAGDTITFVYITSITPNVWVEVCRSDN